MIGITDLLGREINTSATCAAVKAAAAAVSDKFGVLAYFAEAADRGHGWTANSSAEAFANDVDAHGPVAAMERAWARRVKAEPEWPGMSPPIDGRLWNRSRGTAWFITRDGELVTLITRSGRDHEHEVPVVKLRNGRFLAAVVEDGGECWLVRNGGATPAPWARVGAVVGNPRHALPEGVEIIIEGARRARAARR